MLYFMFSSAHYPHGGFLMAGTMSGTAFVVGLGIILAIEANAIWGKMWSFMTSVRDVIISSIVLAVLLSSVAYYL